MFAQGISINRADLRSVSATPSTSTSSDIAEDVRACLDIVLGEVVETKPSQIDALTRGSENDKDDMEFRLFGSNASGRVIRIRSPSPSNKEPGFLGPPRPLSYYLAGELTEESKQKLMQAAISGDDILKLSRSRWYGCALPWRVIAGENSKAGKVDFSSLGPSSAVVKKKGRRGKKHRIAIRKKAALERERKEAAQRQAEEKEAHLREKKTRQNRERQLKRRAKEKAKKAELAALQE